MNGFSLQKCEEKYGVPFSKYGGQTTITQTQESLIKVIQVYGDWSCPLSTLDIRIIAKRVLNKDGLNVQYNKENLPGTFCTRKEDIKSSFLLDKH